MTISLRTIGYLFPVILWKFNSKQDFEMPMFFLNRLWRFLKNGHLSVILHSAGGGFPLRVQWSWIRWIEKKFQCYWRGSYFSQFLWISMCWWQHSMGKIQSNNYHHGSCGPSLFGKTFSVSSIFTYWTIIEWEVSLIGAECLKYLLPFGLQTKWKLTFKEQSFAHFPL